jgi:hypothetical protein
MTSSMPPDMVDEIREQALAYVRDMMLEVTLLQKRPDGTTYGDVTLSRGERILRFQDFAMRGVLDTLRVVKPKLLDEIVKQYQKDMAAEQRKPAPAELPEPAVY